MKKHNILIEFETDKDEVARLIQGAKRIGKLSELIESVLHLHLTGYYQKKETPKPKEEPIIESSQAVDAFMNLLLDIKEGIESVNDKLQEGTPIATDGINLSELVTTIKQISSTTEMSHNSVKQLGAIPDNTPLISFEESEEVKEADIVIEKSSSGSKKAFNKDKLSALKKLKGGS